MKIPPQTNPAPFSAQTWSIFHLKWYNTAKLRNLGAYLASQQTLVFLLYQPHL